MKIEYHKNFTKQFEKLQRKEQERVLNLAIDKPVYFSLFYIAVYF